MCRIQQSILRCPWRGVAKYEVAVPLMQEILLLEKLTADSSLIVPERYSGRLMKIEVLQGDVTCAGIIAPSFVSVYVDRQRCVSKVCITAVSNGGGIFRVVDFDLLLNVMPSFQYTFIQ